MFFSLWALLACFWNDVQVNYCTPVGEENLGLTSNLFGIHSHVYCTATAPYHFYLSSPKPGHTTGRSSLGAQRGSEAEQNRTPTEQFAQETSDPSTPQGIVDTFA